jgi:hypothetical protein
MSRGASLEFVPPLLVFPGLVGLLAGPWFADYALRRPPPDGADPSDPGQVAAPAFLVRNPGGARIGTLEVQYPRSMRENEARPIQVRYVAAPAWRAGFAAYRGVRIEASVGGARLNLTPEPARYAFRNDRIAARGEDGRGWEISPQAEGDYRLHLRLEVEPADFSVGRIAANGQEGAAGDDVSLPVTVYTRYSVSQTTVDIAKAAASLAGFLLTLPLLSSLAKWWVGSRRRSPAGPPDKPRPKKAKGGAPRPPRR